MNRNKESKHVIERVFSISDLISEESYKRIKTKLQIRTFLTIPLTISATIYLYSSLLQGEMRNPLFLFELLIVTFIVVWIMWLFQDTDKQVKKEKQREEKRKKKSKRRIAVEYGVLLLVLIGLIVYAVY